MHNIWIKILIKIKIMEFRTIIEVEFRDYDRIALEKSSEWLNDPEIKSLTMTSDFDRESQEKWFQSLETKNDYYIQVAWLNNEPIGVFGIKNITDTDGEIWGYIGEKKYWGKAIAPQMMNHVFNYARSAKLKSLYSIMLKENLNSYKISRRFGFEKEKDLDDNKIMMRLYL